MKAAIWLAGLMVAGTVGAAEPAVKPPPSRASQAWASAPAPAQTAPTPAAQAPATPADTGADAGKVAAPATVEPAVGTTARQAAPVVPAAPAGSAAATASAQDRLALDTTQVTGNRELPRVTYVVPWKNAQLGDLAGRPANSLLDEVLEPVDRDVFRRQVSYYQALRPDTAR